MCSLRIEQNTALIGAQERMEKAIEEFSEDIREQKELKELSLNTNLEEIFEDIDELEKYFNCQDTNCNIDIFSLTNILNEIAETKTGCNILKALKSALIDKNTGRKLEDSIKINISLWTSEYNQYSFSPFSNDKNCLDVIINTKPINEERYVFDKNKITTHNFPANEKSEAYFIAHELTHVISFLNSGVTSEADWKLRKGGLTGGENDLQKIQQDAGWVNFFNETEQMKEVYHGLLLDGFTPKQIIDTFRTFFLNTEEARNVLGLVKVNIDGQETFIGEGEMFKERNRFDGVIVTYLNEPRQLNVIEKAILNKIIDIFQLGVSYINNCPQFLDANDALGDQFEGFNLVNVPRENSAIAATLNANGESLDRVDEISNNISNFLQIHNLDFETSYCMNHDALRDINSIAYNINKSIVVVQSDDKNPQTYTFKKFDTNGQVTTPKSFEEIKEKNPNAVFIYYNGVNHFQAMVPQQPAQ